MAAVLGSLPSARMSSSRRRAVTSVRSKPGGRTRPTVARPDYIARSMAAGESTSNTRKPPEAATARMTSRPSRVWARST